jgi:hypothetical protein
MKNIYKKYLVNIIYKVFLCRKKIHIVNLSSHDQLPPETQTEKDEFEQVKEAVEKEEEQQPEIIEEPQPKPKRKPAAKKTNIEPQNEIVEEPKPKRKPAAKKINVKVEPIVEEKPPEIIEEKKMI